MKPINDRVVVRPAAAEEMTKAISYNKFYKIPNDKVAISPYKERF